MLRQNQRIIAFDGREYLGRELARAEGALRTGEAYVQDAAPELQSRNRGSRCRAGRVSQAK